MPPKTDGVKEPDHVTSPMRWKLALTALVCLSASAPPVWFPGAGFLVVVGWGAFYALLTDSDARRRRLAIYLVGLGHMLFFSFSLRYVMLPAYIGVGFAGGLYYLLTSWWTRALRRFVPGAVAFGCGLAGALWLRANFVEIQYPHVQPAHSLYQWPVLLGGLRVGGEVFVNFLLGAMAAGAVDVYRGWRVGRPSFLLSRNVFLGALGVYVVSAVPWRAMLASPAGPERVVRIHLIEPRIRPYSSVGSAAEWVQLIHERVIRPTLLVASRQVQSPPELVVWPESIGVQRMMGTSARPRLAFHPDFAPFSVAPGTQVIQGAVLAGDDGSLTVTALQVDHRFRYLGHHEKQHMVPGGEHAPFLDFLPVSWSEAIRGWFEKLMGVRLPETSFGLPRPPLLLEDGTKFGAVTCFDNAFPGPFEHLAKAGAAFILVLSNENWYLGGAELDQMHAMTVCRALEVGLPVVRSTVDGATMAIGSDGRVLTALPPSDDYSRGRNLPVNLKTFPSADRAVPWLRPWLTGLILLSLGALLVPLLGSWGRLDRVRTE